MDNVVSSKKSNNNERAYFFVCVHPKNGSHNDNQNSLYQVGFDIANDAGKAPMYHKTNARVHLAPSSTAKVQCCMMV